MTLAQKILARHAGRDRVNTGDLLMAQVDMVLGTDVTCALSIEVFREMGATRVFDTEKIALVNDHFVPAKDVQAATLSQIMRNFAREQGIRHYYEVGRSGICHALLPDQGLVAPGNLVVGADSHTCTYGALGALSTGIGSTDMACAWALGELWFRVPETVQVVIEGNLPPFVGAKDLILHIIGRLGVDGALYQAIEFSGSTIRKMGMDGRFTICNMAIETGAKTGLIEPDEVTWKYVESVQGKCKAQTFDARVGKAEFCPDPDAIYSRILEIDASALEPLVAQPYLPSNVAPARTLGTVKVDQVVLGSCTNGRMDDFRAAASVLDGYEVNPGVRLIVIPSTPDILQQLIKEGLAERFIAAGATLSPPTCGPCIGGHMGVLAAGETGLFTTNRNFHGRNGHPDSRVFLCGPQVAAASAVAGHIADPRG